MGILEKAGETALDLAKNEAVLDKTSNIMSMLFPYAGLTQKALDMYIRMYDEMKRNEGDNPTLGIVLCSDTDEDIAKYSVLHGHEQLFASKYKTCLPSEEQLREEIEIQKRFYYLQKKEDEELGEDR